MWWQPSFAILDDRVRRWCFFACDHKRERAPGNAHNRYFLHLWDFIDYFFHIPRKCRLLLELSWIPHIRFARDDTIISIFIHLRDIACEKPAILCKYFFRRHRIFPISHHHLWTTHGKLADLTLFYFLAALGQI